MNHGVTIRANDGEVNEFGLGSVLFCRERFEVMHLCVISTKLAINSLEIKTAAWHFTFKFAISPIFWLLRFYHREAIARAGDV